MPDKITNEGKFNVVFCLTEGGQAERKLWNATDSKMIVESISKSSEDVSKAVSKSDQRTI
jgi:hypothetical protein